MQTFYSLETNALNLVALLKAHNIRKVVASPGATDVNLIVSMQNDGFFEMYSCVDERSAAFMACGMAAESNEPVAIVCTEASASRNYYPALTEAYHRKLPILAITGLHDYNFIGNLEPQVIDRSISPVDTFKLKVHLPIIKDDKDDLYSQFLINKALLELTHHGGGPVHINIPSFNNMVFTQKDLPNVRVINRYMPTDEMPDIDKKRIAIFCGVHTKWNDNLIKATERFCSIHNSAIWGCAACGYNGKYKILSTTAGLGCFNHEMNDEIEILIHIGQESGDYNIRNMFPSLKEVWRVDSDGELRDYFGKLTKVFEMEAQRFFEYYSFSIDEYNDSYLQKCLEYIKTLMSNIPDFPFSNIYAASKITPLLPKDSVLHLGMSNSLRAWMLFPTPQSVYTYANLGTRGIDGCLSTMIGASQIHKNKLFFGVFGDLAFLYDLNAMGNRHIGNNIRIILVNNDGGCIFRTWGHDVLGRNFLDEYISASGHLCGKSKDFVHHLSEDMGFDYMSANDKDSFEQCYKKFTTMENTDKPMILELFTKPEDEIMSFSLVNDLRTSEWKKTVKKILGKQGTTTLKKILGK